MCDTMVVLPKCTGDGSLLFAKNSDREPNEPHIIVKVPRHRIEPSDKIECTYISIENSDHSGLQTNETILFKPSWIWGAEMGVNEKGLVIGNEAVFTRVKVEDKTLLGMDILRLALELCSTAKEAVSYITALIEKYGQGGKAGYTENLKYHNSYLIADFEEAYVLETAGRHWVYEKVKDIYSISNTLSIGNKYENSSSGLIEYAQEKGWCRKRDEFDFKTCYESRLHPHFTKGDVRRNSVEDYFREKMGSLNVADMKSILRSHCGNDKVSSFRTGSMESICMHAGGGLITSQTTGSFVVQLKDGKINIWATGSSVPCISIFKPIWFSSCLEEFFSEQNQDELEAYWRDIELFHRSILGGSFKGLEAYINERDLLEQELTALAAAADNDEKRTEITNYAFSREKSIIDTLFNKQNSRRLEKTTVDQGSLYYRLYWAKQNKKLNKKY